MLMVGVQFEDDLGILALVLFWVKEKACEWPKSYTILLIKTNIAFARGGVHLPIAHALRLPDPEIFL